MSNIYRLKKELNHIAKLRSELYNRRKKFAEKVYVLNKQYKQSEINHFDYSEKFESLLGNRTIDGLEKQHRRKIESLNHRDHAIRNVIRRQELKKSAIVKTAVLSVMVMLAISMPFTIDSGITGFATSQSVGTTATANIIYYYALAESTDFSSGIDFGTITHNTQNNNATVNYDNSGTGYALNLSADSNTDISICVKANTDLKIHSSPSNIIGIGNMTFNASTTNTSSTPSFSTRTEMNTSVYRNATHNLGAGNATFFRFWLTVPDATVPGTYNNTAEFKAVRAGTDCA
ncbi:hypothetical protein HOH11_03105 [Candidatus Woesearchaeota archaeon]|nr:hypothetical protein [Candidatus Woesearchaeota archaeon]MBT6023559.1 hypothetical protein [Candidatus Woesearchaeota archaeon]